MKENKNYNATDFARYHSGTMPPDEMHALEKAALEDPFLADAMEGYAYSKHTKKETDEIRRQLNEKRKQEKRFSLLSFSQNTWWKIAAMLVIICGAGYLFFFMNIKKEHRQVVKQEVIKKEQGETISHLNKDTTSEETNIAFEKASPEKDKINVRKLPAPVSKPIRITTENPEREGGINRKKEFSEDRLVSEKENQLAMKKKAAVVREITTDDSVNTLLFRSSDTAAFIAVSPKGYSKDSANVLVMNDTKPSLEEVVVVGYGAKKRSGVTGELQGKVSGIQTNANTPYLLEGKERFDQYIKDNVTSFPDSVDILLSFTLDKYRQPNRIKVIESSCQSCEKEAIRLLKDGPAWIGKSGSRGTVRIKF